MTAPDTGPITVLIVDDHPVVRRGLRVLLEVQDGIEVAGEAGDGATALALAAELSPDVVLLDLKLPGMQMLPQIAQGDANKVWIVPSEIGKALEGIGGFFSSATAARTQGPESPPASSGPGPQLDAPVGRHASLEGWLAGGSGPMPRLGLTWPRGTPPPGRPRQPAPHADRPLSSPRSYGGRGPSLP